MAKKKDETQAGLDELAEAQALADAEAQALADAEAQALADAEAQAVAEPTGNTLTNVGINHRCINRVNIARGDSYELTKRDLADVALMTKVDRAVELGVLARG